ncbi:MAG TPA: alcohol dehydrogenase, partial [Gammaproteobacteria bacterium]|nr:alcohol dehydrogenase [Gammaproteobacteria bacterium]
MDMGTPARVVVLPADTAKLRVESLELPDPGPHQVVVKQFASGICHSQLHQMHAPRRSPIILGHESTGVVLEVGSAVTHVVPGDTVMVTWVPRNATAESIPPVAATLAVSDGTAASQNVFTWADHTIADQQYVVKVDPNIKTDVTAIIG